MKNFKKILGNQQGLSLIEVIVAAAISVIISGAVMKTNQTGIQGAKTVEGNISLAMWQANVFIRELSDPGTCLANFNTTTLNADQYYTSLQDGQGGTLIQDGATIDGKAGGGNWRLANTTASLKSITRKVFVPDTAGSLKGRCDLEIWVERTKKTLGGAQRKLTVPMICTKATSSNTMISCAASVGSQDSLWAQQLASGPDAPYIYSTQNVLIGTQGQSVTTPFQVDLKDGVDFPAGSGSGINAGMRLNNNGALLFNDDAVIHGDGSKCLITVTDNASGSPFTVGKQCAGSIQIGSTGMTITAPAASANASTADDISNIAIGALNSTLSGNSSMVLGASGVNVSGQRAVGLGEGNTISGARSMATGTDVRLKTTDSLAVGAHIYNNAGAYNLLFGSSLFAGGTTTVGTLFGGQSNYIKNGAYDSIIVGGSLNIGNLTYGLVVGQTNYVSCENCFALGKNLAASLHRTMVLGGDYAFKIGSIKTDQFTAGFKNGYRFFTNASSVTDEAHAFYIDTNGRVGVGKDVEYSSTTAKLYVNGMIRVGNGSTTCNADAAGVMRFDDAAAQMKYCNGSGWISM